MRGFDDNLDNYGDPGPLFEAPEDVEMGIYDEMYPDPPEYEYDDEDVIE